jgi:hypothetical protein
MDERETIKRARNIIHGRAHFRPSFHNVVRGQWDVCMDKLNIGPSETLIALLLCWKIHGRQEYFFFLKVGCILLI